MVNWKTWRYLRNPFRADKTACLHIRHACPGQPIDQLDFEFNWYNRTLLVLQSITRAHLHNIHYVRFSDALRSDSVKWSGP
jgi:hypothetical protein